MGVVKMKTGESSTENGRKENRKAKQVEYTALFYVPTLLRYKIQTPYNLFF